MVTTRRSSNQVTNAFEQFATAGGNVMILERPASAEEVVAPVATAKPVKGGFTEEQLREAEERRKNLDRLLNYDRYSEQMSAAVVTEEHETVSAEKVAEVEVALSDEDIKPTSTTMQFGEDIEGIREEMMMERAVAEEDGLKIKYRIIKLTIKKEVVE
jgi:ribosomal protein L2